MDRFHEASNQDLLKENGALKKKLHAALDLADINMSLAAWCLIAILSGVLAIGAACARIGDLNAKIKETQDDVEFWRAIVRHKTSVLDQYGDEITRLRYENAKLDAERIDMVSKLFDCGVTHIHR